ncbi:hypothetical protein PENSPDRAFT_737823 [Peniophora sp. CONT]|nr:hypothetical protein PENSPDRAFT_737823 [Peniophora sp. CONT]
MTPFATPLPVFPMATRLIHTLHLLAFLAASVYAQSQTFFPGSVPLAAKTTYLNAYVGISNQSNFASTWPVFASNPQQVVGWAGLVRIDGSNSTYGWLGRAATTQATVLGLTVTPTRTVWTMRAGTLDLNITFLSPIEPGDYVRQSIPFSYVTFEATSNDGNAHTVQIYSDMTGEWAGGDRSQAIKWATTADSDKGNVYHGASLSSPQLFTEFDGQASWGTAYYAAKSGSGFSYKTGFADDCRNQFAANGALDGGKDTSFRAITDRFPVFSFSYDLGSIKATSGPTVFAAGFVRDPAIKYTDLSGTSSQRSLYYNKKYTDIGSLINFVLGDYSGALSRAVTLDNKLTAAAQSVVSGNTLSDIASLTTRNIFGSTELTIGVGSDGKLNGSDVMMFMRNTNGDQVGRVNPVEQLYSAWPAIMTIDPTLGPPLLEPLLRFQQSSSYVIQFAAPDLGTSYPNATAANNAHRQGVEMSSNMILMAWAHAKYSGNGQIIGQYYGTFKKWADYLVDNALLSTNQLDADGNSADNSTNLAIKGILAIAAMEQISSAVGVDADKSMFKNATQTLYSQWKGLALGSNNKMEQTYGKPATWTIGYGLFADKWLGLGLVDSVIYSGQTSQMQSLLSAQPAVTKFGIPSGTGTDVDSNYNMMAAAYASDASVASDIITRIFNRANLTASNDLIPQVYNSSTGATTQGQFNPAIGAVYGPMALSLQAASSITIPPGSGQDAPSAKSSIAGPVAGGVVGGLAALAAIIAAVWFFRRRRHNDKRRRVDLMLEDRDHGDDNENAYKDHPGFQATPFPFTGTSRIGSMSRRDSGSRSVDSSTPALSRQPPESSYGQGSSSGQGDAYPDNESRTTGPLGLRNPHPRDPTMRAVNVGPGEDIEAAASAAGATASEAKLIAERRRNAANPATPSFAASSAHTRGASNDEAGTSAGRPSGDTQLAQALREEVLSLRREMEEIKMNTIEPPPSYAA